MKGTYLILFFLILSSTVMLGQSPNINCATALEITNPVEYCSGVDEFDNTNAGGSEYAVPDCWDSGENDLWFSFTAQAVVASIVVNGEAGGDLDDPQVILYKGDDCSMVFLTDACESASIGDEIAAVIQENLVVGDNYFIRVSGRFGRQGTFQICMNNYNNPVEPGQDCATSTILCDKSSFVVQNVVGAGLDPDEGNGTCLSEGISGNSERKSTWFKWICKESGTLTFDIVPLVSIIDLDFALYRLPNGIEDCEREVLRCNATQTGIENDCGINTGLDESSTDISEDIGCDPTKDGYVRYVDMVAGDAYALLINNFNDKGGFTIDFGGTGTFEGPIPDFEIIPDPNQACGISSIVNNLSEAGLYPIIETEWNFGEGANPETGTGNGPFNVSYSSSGEKFIVLTVFSEIGCEVTEVRTINLDECPESYSIVIDSIKDASCEGIGGGYIEVSGLAGCPEYMFNIDGGTFSNANIFDNLDMGNYTIGMMDMNGCETDTLISILTGANFTVEAGDDVSLNIDGSPTFLNVTTTALGDLTVTWDPTDGISCTDGSFNCLNPEVNPTMTTTYTVTVEDENACVAFDNITVFVDQCINSILSLTLDSTKALICEGAQDGYIAISGQNGELDYQFSINGGAFSPNGIFSNLGTGSYGVAVQDGFGCVIDSVFEINSLPPFTVNTGDDVTFDTPGDTIFINATTTAENIISALWNPSSSVICTDGSPDCLDPIVRPSVTGDYTLTVTDENGCTASDVIRFVFEENTDIYIPNVFSPNEDGINDFFTLLGDPAFVSSIEELLIFDRWGNKVYQGIDLSPTDANAGWDGNMNGNKLQQGVYTWSAKVRFISKPDGEAEQLKGSITLIR